MRSAVVKDINYKDIRHSLTSITHDNMTKEKSHSTTTTTTTMAAVAEQGGLAQIVL